MPKRGWNWRKEWLRSLTDEQLESYLHVGRISAKQARWLHENMPLNAHFRIRAITAIGWDHRASWAPAYLWRELEKHKSEPFGDWVVVGLAASNPHTTEDAMRFIELYYDESAHADTRGSAIFALNTTVQMGEHLSEVIERIREVCAEALRDSDPYARAGACWLARSLGGFDEELKELASDHTPCRPPENNITVAEHAYDPPMPRRRRRR